jgi:nucleoid DNA-binding protein
MEQPREALIARLVKESGLNDSEARRFLNALVVCMNEDLERSKRFTMPGVGTLTLAAEAAAPQNTAQIDKSGRKRDQSTWIKPPLTGIPPAPAVVWPGAIIPGIVDIVGEGPLTGIKPAATGIRSPVAEPAPDGLLPDTVIDCAGDAGLPLGQTIRNVFLSEADNGTAEAGEDPGIDDILKHEP